MMTARSSELFGPERLLAFSDGVFAVAITLLVIDLHLPPLPHAGDAELLAALHLMGPNLLIFVFTFVIVGMTWLGHHRKFSYIAKVDNRLLWLNIFYLMILCLVPFVTSVLSEHSGRVGFILYSIVMAVLSLISAASSAYGLRAPYLAVEHLNADSIWDMVLAPLSTGIIFLLAGAVAYVSNMDIAPWLLLAIVPASALLGSRARKASKATG